MRAFRIADFRRPVFDGMGAMFNGGRWNSPGRPLIYAAQTYAGAMLEILVHTNISMAPKNHVSVEIEIPARIIIETIGTKLLRDWPSTREKSCRALGDEWLSHGRSAVLIVPSIVTLGRECNVLINPLHPDFKKIRVSEPTPVTWDTRFFSRKA